MELLWTAAAFAVLLLALAGLAGLATRALHGRVGSLIDELPGPKAFPIVGNFFDDFSHRTDIMWKITEREKRYPQIYRLWHGPTPVVYTSSPEVFEKMLGMTSRNLSKGFFYKFLMPWLGEGLLTSAGGKWFAHRKLLTPAFHHRILSLYLNVINDNTKVLLDKLGKKADEGTMFDVYPLISLCTLDIICEAAMGIKINAQTHNQSPYAAAIYRVLDITKDRFLRFWMFPDVVFYATKLGKEYKEQVRRLHDFTSGIIRERRRVMRERKASLPCLEDLEVGMTKKPRAFLDLLLRAAEDNEEVNLTDTDIREEVDTFTFEGHETTAVALSWTLLLLAMNEGVQERAHAEQVEIFGEDTTREASMRDLSEMKLLERVVKETLRIYPSIPLIARIPDEDVRCDGYTIPGGTTVILNIFGLHRNPTLHPDPERFDPDRFLPENSRARNPYSHVPFSAGSRNCIGQKFALLEEKVILSSIIRNFRVVTTVKSSDIKLVNHLLLRSEDGVNVKLVRRRGPMC